MADAADVVVVVDGSGSGSTMEVEAETANMPPDNEENGDQDETSQGKFKYSF